MSKVTWKQIHKLTEEERWDIRGYDDVKSIFGTNNIEDFPKDFDVKAVSGKLNLESSTI